VSCFFRLSLRHLAELGARLAARGTKPSMLQADDGDILDLVIGYDSRLRYVVYS
jgi:septum formation inhibitor-activating ATPase MinD